jgi:hypothetical protein
VRRSDLGLDVAVGAAIDGGAEDAAGDAPIDAGDADAAIDASAPDAPAPDACVATPDPDPPRPIAPLSTATVTSQRPTLRFVLPTGADGAMFNVCADRACTNVVATFARATAARWGTRSS